MEGKTFIMAVKAKVLQILGYRPEISAENLIEMMRMGFSVDEAAQLTADICDGLSH